MLDTRFKKFYERSRLFLDKASSLDEVLYEIKVSHEEMLEIIQIVSEAQERFDSVKRRYDWFIAEKRDLVFQKFKERGITATQQNIEDHVMRIFKPEFSDLRREYDEAKLNFETASTIRNALFQRKDFLVSMATFFNSKHEAESCIMTNKSFVRKLIHFMEEK